MKGKPAVKRCAIYTRKSSEEGLEQDFNSLHAQREACEAFIKSQKGEGWALVPTAYDDGGLSGGTMERPALQRLLADIALKKVDVVVVYKVDRLTRSLADFAKMVEVFDAHTVSFVAVTQQFNTTSSMGRLTLNILLSFAQFEREVTGERIRDKIAASKKKGMWMGGNVPLGYDVRDRKLEVNAGEAERVRHIFRRYLDLGCVRRLRENLQHAGHRSKSGGSFSRGALYALLSNPLYIGEIRHKDVRHPGLHQAIIGRELWDAVQARLASNAPERQANRKVEASPLLGKLFDENGERLTPSHAVKNGRRYRYYISQSLVTGGGDGQRRWRLPAHALESMLAEAVRHFVADPGAVSDGARDAGMAAEFLPVMLDRLKWDPAEPLSMVQRVDLGGDGLALTVALPHPTGEPVLVRRHLPMTIRRRGVEMRLVIDDGRAATAKADPALLKAILRARAWFDDLIAGRISSLAAIAKRDGLSDSYVGHLLPLAFLAPDIVEAIVAGTHPADLTAEALVKHIELPLQWDQQKAVLGFA
ncbi:MAG TPA: recombinase family protein [Magnetospirillum sp.]|nr:recombinase family protein [Magnetospirillum sp.]